MKIRFGQKYISLRDGAVLTLVQCAHSSILNRDAFIFEVLGSNTNSKRIIPVSMVERHVREFNDIDELLYGTI